MSTRSDRKGLSYRPALLLLSALASGIWLASVYYSPIVVISCAIACIGCGALCLFHDATLIRFSCLLIATIAIGYGAGAIESLDKQSSRLPLLARFHNEKLVLFGRLDSPCDSGAFNAKTILRCDSVQIGSSMLSATERIALVIRLDRKFSSALLPTQGQYVKAFAELEDPSKKHNPYETSISAAISRKTAAQALAIVENPYEVYVLDSTVSRSITENISAAFLSIRSFILDRLHASIADSAAQAIASAMVLGEKKELNREVTDDFRNAGLSHILVVSGFNVAIVAAVIYYLLRLLGIVRLRWRIAISMVAVACYGLTIGLEPSILRAVIAVEFVFLALLLERKPDVGNITAAAAALALLLDPSALFDPSFQLTYGAVFSLVLIYPKLSSLFISERWRNDKRLLPKIIRAIAETFFTSLAVTMGLLPVMVFHFHHVTITAVLSNLIGIPIAALLTIISFLLIPLSIVPWIAGVYGEVVTMLSYMVILVADYSAGITSLRVSMPQFTVIGIALFYAAILFVIGKSMQKKQVYARTTIVMLLVGFLMLCDVPLSAERLTPEETLSVLFFDVGQGDAALLRTPDGKAYLIDLGGLRKDGTSVAERAILPMLNAEGISRLDACFITHMHIDHYAGAVSLLGSGMIDRLYVSGYPGKGYYVRVFDSLISAKQIAVSELTRGMTIQLDDEVTMYLLNPDSIVLSPNYFEHGNEANHTSLAMKIVYRNSSMLFLGDLEGEDEERIVKRYGDFLKSDIVKVAHHGSRYSSSRNIVEASKPSYAIFSVGESNTFGHPTSEALSRWNNGGAGILRTDREGAILFHSNGDGISKYNWKEETVRKY